jgi:hypothetical protein
MATALTPVGSCAEWNAYQRWRSAFADVIDPRFYSLVWLDDQIWNGQARFWSSDTAAIVATINEYPAGGKEVHGLIAAGDLDGIRGLISLAEQWGRRCGAIVGTIDSRAGWARVMTQDGYAPYQWRLRKELV